MRRWLVGALALLAVAALLGATSPRDRVEALRVVNVREFGATGDGSTDDTAAIMAALNAAVARTTSNSDQAKTVLVPPGVYTISSTLALTDVRNFRLLGIGGGQGGLNGVVFRWNGTAGGTVLSLNRVRDAEFGYFAIVAGSATFGVGLDIDQDASGAWISTHNGFHHIHIDGGSTAAIRLSNTATANNELHVFEDVVLTGAGPIGYQIKNAQSKHHRILGGSIGNKTTGISQTFGSFYAYGVNFDNNTTDISLTNVVDTISILNCHSEGATKFLNISAAGTSAWAVMIQGSRLSPASGATTYIEYNKMGPLVLIGNDFADGNNRPNWRLGVSGFGGTGGATVVAIGNIFPNNTPFALGVVANLTSLGNLHVQASMEGATLYSHIGASGSGVHTANLSLSGVVGISATKFSAQNLRGSHQFLGSGSVTAHLAFTEPDARYHVVATANANETIWVTGKTTTTFVLNSHNAASTATVDWILVR